MNVINQSINLNVLKRSYFTKEARIGMEMLDLLINKDDQYSLEELLRNHEDKAVNYFFEVDYRSKVDEFLQFIALLTIANLTGYINVNGSLQILKKYRRILDNKHVLKYYTIYYPSALPQLFRLQLLNVPQNQYEPTTKKVILFEKFLIISDLLDDENIKHFLSLLDGQTIGGYSIDDVSAVLTNKDRLIYKINTTRPHPLNQGIWGFVNYIQFLESYFGLLNEAEDDKLVQSALWHFQSYWFQQMNSKLRNVLIPALLIIAEESKNINALEISELGEPEAKDYKINWKAATDSIDSLKFKIEYLLNNNFNKEINQIIKGQTNN